MANTNFFVDLLRSIYHYLDCVDYGSRSRLGCDSMVLYKVCFFPYRSITTILNAEFCFVSQNTVRFNNHRRSNGLLHSLHHFDVLVFYSFVLYFDNFHLPLFLFGGIVHRFQANVHRNRPISCR